MLTLVRQAMTFGVLPVDIFKKKFPYSGVDRRRERAEAAAAVAPHPRQVVVGEHAEERGASVTNCHMFNLCHA